MYNIFHTRARFGTRCGLRHPPGDLKCIPADGGGDSCPYKLCDSIYLIKLSEPLFPHPGKWVSYQIPPII
jgi:hypothetical protein